MAYGANKYGEGNYKQPPDISKLRYGLPEVRYVDAMMRHILKFIAGEEKDSESGLEHLAHVLANVAIILELRRLNGKEEKKTT